MTAAQGDGRGVTEAEVEAGAIALWRLEWPADDSFSQAAPNDWSRWPETPKQASLAYVTHSRQEYREQAQTVFAARPAPAGDAEEVARLRSQVAVEVDAAVVQDARFQRLLIAFHDATRRPLGVTPASGDEFYDWRMAEAAEERRPRHGSEGERRERPEVRLVAAQREKAAAIGLLDGHASVVRQLEREKAAAETALAEARAENDRLLSVLRKVEWIPTSGSSHRCPVCRCSYPEHNGVTHGHAPDCALAAALATATAEGGDDAKV